MGVQESLLVRLVENFPAAASIVLVKNYQTFTMSCRAGQDACTGRPAARRTVARLTWNYGSETEEGAVYNTGNSDATGSQARGHSARCCAFSAVGDPFICLSQCCRSLAAAGRESLK
eukprot:6208949-Pleurochrysis_carterae.AAC.1